MKKATDKVSYNVIFTPEPEGGYTVTVPSLPGCITYGKTFEVAEANAREAVSLYVEDMLESGEKVAGDKAPVVSSISFTSEELKA